MTTILTSCRADTGQVYADPIAVEGNGRGCLSRIAVFAEPLFPGQNHHVENAHDAADSER